MPTLKVLIPESTYQQLLTVAGRAWRPPLWHAEWLLRKAIEAEAEADPEAAAILDDAQPQEGLHGGSHEEETLTHVR
jgi:hypothetical protein